MNREVSLLRLFFRRQSVLLWIGSIFLVIGLGALVATVLTGLEERRYQAEAAIAEGIVLTKDIRRATRNGERRTSYRVTFRFTTQDGQVITGTESVNVDTWEALRERDPVQVQYLPDDPLRHRIAGTGGWILVIITLLFGSIFGTVGGVLVAKGLPKLLLERRLLREGRRTEATVTGVTESNVRINGRTQWILHYRYQDDLGQTHEGRSGYMSYQDAHAWHIGDKGAILVDRQRPGQSIWIGEQEPGESVPSYT